MREPAVKTDRVKCLNALDLKVLAMALMLCDHLWATVISEGMWLSNLGRLAFPIFAFQVAEGYAHTRNFKRYLGRMFLWALVSEVPFNLMYSGGTIYPFHQNVLFTFCLALVLIRLIDWAGRKGKLLYCLAAVLACGAGYVLGMITMVDYYGYGVLTVLFFYLCRSLPCSWLWQLAGVGYVNLYLLKGMLFPISILGWAVEFPQQGLALLALIPIWLYNGRQGPHNRAIQYTCYAFYPVHMLILAVLNLYVLI